MGQMLSVPRRTGSLAGGAAVTRPCHQVAGEVGRLVTEEQRVARTGMARLPRLGRGLHTKDRFSSGTCQRGGLSASSKEAHQSGVRRDEQERAGYLMIGRSLA